MFVLLVKNREIKELALASTGINLDKKERESVLTEILSLKKENWYRCQFRNCDLLLIYGGDNVLEKNKINWTDTADQCPNLKLLINKILDPFFKTKPRIIILKTNTEEELNWHVDCNKEEIYGFQPKLRCLISGKKDDLYYLSEDGNKIRTNITSDIYYMSGAFVHALKNTSREERYVLCFGSPWKEEHVKPQFIELLNNLSEDRLLWNDNLKYSDREKFVRIPKKHGLIKYGTV